jgi:hypothetical protein
MSLDAARDGASVAIRAEEIDVRMTNNFTLEVNIGRWMLQHWNHDKRFRDARLLSFGVSSSSTSWTQIKYRTLAKQVVFQIC